MIEVVFSLPVWISSLLFALTHSLFASEWCKQWFYRFGMTSQHYRLLYSLFAVALTIGWLFYIYQLPDSSLYRIEGWQNGLMLAVQLSGLGIALYSLKSFDAGLFLGLKSAHGEPEPFHERGIYRHVRHPMYTGVMLALLASPVQSINSLNLALSICCYFVSGSWFEERRMLKAHPQYADYIMRVPAFLPWRALFRRPRRTQ